MKTRSERTASLSSSATEPENDAAFIERLRSIVAIAGSASALARNAGISQGGCLYALQLEQEGVRANQDVGSKGRGRLHGTPPVGWRRRCYRP